MSDQCQVARQEDMRKRMPVRPPQTLGGHPKQRKTLSRAYGVEGLVTKKLDEGGSCRLELAKRTGSKTRYK